MLVCPKHLAAYQKQQLSYIVSRLREDREFVYIGDPVPELNEQEHAKFLLNVQKSILFSLEKRGLLTGTQRERCLTALEQQYSRSQKSKRRA